MRRRSKRILAVLGIVVLLLGVTYGVLLGRAAIKLRRAYAALVAEGRPMQTAEIIPAKVPDSENAAVLYQSAVLMLKSEPAGNRNVFEWLTGHLPGPENAAKRKELIGQDVVASALALVEEGTRRPACQFDSHLGDSLEWADEQLTEVEKLVAVIGARASWEMQARCWDRAWDLLLLRLKFADSLRGDPMITRQHSRLIAVDATCSRIRDLCESAPLDASRYQAFEGLLKGLENTDPLVRAVDAERLLIGERFFRLPRSELDRVLWKEVGGDRSTPQGLLKAIHRLSFTVIAFKPRLVADHAAYLSLARKRVQLLQGPYRDRKETEAFLQTSRWNLLTNKLAWNAGSDTWYYWRVVTHLHLTRAGLALLQYQQAHGAFPETLAALGVEGLTDPYTGKSLLYRPEGAGFVVYSVGQDGQDNGGFPKPEREDSDPRRRHAPCDEVWRFPNPKTQPAASSS